MDPKKNNPLQCQSLGEEWLESCPVGKSPPVEVFRRPADAVFRDIV